MMLKYIQLTIGVSIILQTQKAEHFKIKKREGSVYNGKGSKTIYKGIQKHNSRVYNSGKSLAELSSEYALSKSTISGWVKKKKSVTVDKNITITAEEYQAMQKKNKQLEEELEILKKAMGIFARK